MALMAKIASAASSAGVSSNRPVSANSRGGSGNLMGPVDSASPSSGIALDTGVFSAVTGGGDQSSSRHSFMSSQQQQQPQHQSQQLAPSPSTGIIDMSSQGFAEIIELRDMVSAGAFDGQEVGNAKAARSKLHSKVTTSYEASIEIASGRQTIRGESLSIQL